MLLLSVICKFVSKTVPFYLQECPTGIVNEETFKEIYAQFFPQGGKLNSKFLRHDKTVLFEK